MLGRRRVCGRRHPIRDQILFLPFANRAGPKRTTPCENLDSGSEKKFSYKPFCFQKQAGIKGKLTC